MKRAHYQKRIAWKSRRGSTLAIVLCLYLALGAILTGAVTMAATAGRASERDYRRSQALALAEAGIAEARTDAAPHGPRDLGDGRYSWTASGSGAERLVVARGEVVSTTGAVITRSVSARLRRSGASWKVAAWEEGL